MKSGKISMILWMLGCLMLTGMTACSGSDDEPSMPDDGVKLRRLTITQTDGAAARQMVTRATLEEGDGLLTASWTAGDKLTYCNLSRTNPNYEPYSGQLTAASTAATSQFTDDVYCSQGDYLAVVYPATTFKTNDSYTISLSGQDGTLSGLATNYHYVYGMAQVTAVTNETADASMGKMKSLLTVCKFSFKDKSTNQAIPISELKISYNSNDSNNGTYPQEATVAVSYLTAPVNVHAKGVASSQQLTINANGLTEVYVALLPTAAKCKYNFTVSNSSGTYTGTAKATLTEGEFVVATGLKLTKQ